MQKVLIISYFFPPCNLTASQRAFSWAQQLHKHGYFPVVITRRWDYKINQLPDVSRQTPQEVVVEKNENYEVHYIPYSSNLRDRIYLKYGAGKFVFIRKLLTLLELLLQNISNSIIPCNNIFEYTRNYLEQNKSVKLAVITGNPFNFFKLGYTLQRKFGIKWIVDYRDAWTTSDINSIGRNALFSIVNSWDKPFEKKWVRTASCITASSQPIADSVGALTSKPAYALYNGFVQDDFNEVNHLPKYEAFTITYVGTLYAGQKIEIFCEAFKRFIDSNSSLKIKFMLPGLAFYEQQHERIKHLLRGYENYYECTPRVERIKVLETEQRSHLLLHVAWDEQKGIIASKIYEYIASGTKILVVPGDKGSIEEIVTSSESGTCISGVEETVLFLNEKYNLFQNGIVETNNVSSDKVLQYSREKQTAKLAELLSSI